MNLTAQIMVKNEERWIWYAIQSVLPRVNECLIFDTGSTDKTLEIINLIHSDKLVLEEKGEASRERLVELRNEMKDRTKTDWFLLVDGDEIWPGYALEKLSKALEAAPDKIWGLVVRTRNCVGDVWHYQPESAGRYQLLGQIGHLSIRTYRNLPGFYWQGEYPNEAYCDSAGNPLNDQDEHLGFVDTAYWHVTHLFRSTESQYVIDRPKKKKLEIGIKAQPGELPEVFFAKPPSIVPSPFMKPTFIQWLGATIATPLRKVKRRVLK